MSMFVGSGLAFTHFIGCDSDASSLELAIPQFISLGRAGPAALTKSVYFKVWICTHLLLLVLFFTDLFSQISEGDICSIALRSDSCIFLRYRSKINKFARFNAQCEYSILLYQCFPQANVEHIGPSLHTFITGCRNTSGGMQSCPT